MSPQDYVKCFGKLYLDSIALRSDDDYEVNEPQMDRFLDILSLFNEIKTVCGGTIHDLRFSPREEHGGITATFPLVDIYGKLVCRFADAIRYASAVSIDADNDQVTISLSVPNIYRRKEDLPFLSDM